jgi:hypothetical protein
MMSNIGFGVGVAALVGGAVLYLTAPKAAEKAMVSPTVGADGSAGVIVRGRF